MKPEIKKMHHVWDNLQIAHRKPTDLPRLNFNEIISSVFTTGPFYYYIIDFFDFSISNISAGFKSAHGIDPEQIHHINDILSLCHTEDMEFVSLAENKALKYIYDVIGVEKITRYKASYNLRFKTADGSYRLFNHQSLILTVDENNNFIKSLNIHTDISHITSWNNRTFSLIGLMGEPSYLNMEVLSDAKPPIIQFSFSKRETEIVKLITEGLTTRQIAEKLFITTDTVKSHRKHIMEKSGCANMAELTARSISSGWI